MPTKSYFQSHCSIFQLLYSCKQTTLEFPLWFQPVNLSFQLCSASKEPTNPGFSPFVRSETLFVRISRKSRRGWQKRESTWQKRESTWPTLHCTFNLSSPPKIYQWPGPTAYSRFIKQEKGCIVFLGGWSLPWPRALLLENKPLQLVFYHNRGVD